MQVREELQAAVRAASLAGDVDLVASLVNAMRLSGSPAEKALASIEGLSSTAEEIEEAVRVLECTVLSKRAFKAVLGLSLRLPRDDIQLLIKRALSADPSHSYEIAGFYSTQPDCLIARFGPVLDCTVADILLLTLRNCPDTSFRQSVFDVAFNSLFLYHSTNNSNPGIGHSDESVKKILQIAVEAMNSETLADRFTNNKQQVNSLLLQSSHQENRGLVTAVLARVFDLCKHTIPLVTLSAFFATTLGSHTIKGRVTAISALHCLTLAKSTLGISLFTSSGVIHELLDNLQDDTDDIQTLVLLLLSDLSNDSETSIKIAQTFGEDIKRYSAYHQSKAIQTIAKSLHIKLTMRGNKGMSVAEEADQISTLVHTLATQTLSPQATSNAIESLVLLSSKPVNKQILVSAQIVKLFMQICMRSSPGDYYGLSAAIMCVSAYPKRLSDEEVNVAKLRAMSENRPVDAVDPLEHKDAVAARCDSLVSNGVVVALALFAKDASDQLQEMTARILLSLTAGQSSRGRILQSGGVKVLLGLADGKGDSGLVAAQALARLGITSDPSISFKGQRMVELVRPLLRLLISQDTFCQFEGLLCLTNLASSGGEAREKIHTLRGVVLVEGLILSDHFMVQRAAVEALCNLLHDEAIYNEYVANVEKSKVKIRILLALCGSEDFETRRGAGGALCVLTTSAAVARLVSEEAGFSDILRMMEDLSEEIVHRAVVCVRNVCAAGGGLQVVQGGGSAVMQVLAEGNDSLAKIAAEILELLRTSGLI